MDNKLQVLLTLLSVLAVICWRSVPIQLNPKYTQMQFHVFLISPSRYNPVTEKEYRILCSFKSDSAPLSLTKTLLVTAKRMNALLCISKCVSLHGRLTFTPLRAYRLPGSSHLIALSCQVCVLPGMTWPVIRRVTFTNT